MGGAIEVLAGQMSSDERGSSFFFFPEAVDLDLKSLHIVVTKPGQVRGNHAHPTRTEYLFFFGGRGLFAWEEDGQVHQMQTKLDGPLVKISPGIKHAYRNAGGNDAYILACWGPREAPGQDTLRAEILPQEKMNG
jgi:quercetin dioxygenase-like cupin family protein